MRHPADGDRRNVSLSSVSVNIGSRITPKGIPSADNYRKTSRPSPISPDFQAIALLTALQQREEFYTIVAAAA